MNVIRSFHLDIEGPGIIFYSPFSAAHIDEGEDYLEREFSDLDLVEKQALEGRIVGVSTGTPGRFIVEIYEGYPKETFIDEQQFKLRLGIEVREGKLCVRSLFDLLNWNSKCPSDQMIEVEDGFYHITLLSNEPPSGIIGEDQIIMVFLKKLSEMPKLRYNGVPTLC